MWIQQAPPRPLVGFSYSPLISTQLGREPVADLDLLLATTDPDVVRLPVLGCGGAHA